ncbi:MAG: HNH endonuclease signature motif containing protein [Ktedonobacterales bacterium]
MCDACIVHDGLIWHKRPDNGYYTTRLLLHRYVWEQAHGPIPSGYHIHHKNGDKHDNRLENLELLTHGEHSARHYEEKLAPHREVALRNAQQTQERQRQERLQRVLLCVVCGGEYHSGAVHPTRFCSPECVEAARSGAFRSESRTCEQCGASYQATRRAQRYCSRLCNQRASLQREATLVERTVTCEQCATPFRSKRSNARFCCRACALAFHGNNRFRGKVSQAV